MEIHEILVSPKTTEKAAVLTERHQQVVFRVGLTANKHQVKDAVEKQYGVRVLAVRTSISHGKLKRRGASVGRRPNWKKAIVTLAEGASIDFFATE